MIRRISLVVAIGPLAALLGAAAPASAAGTGTDCAKPPVLGVDLTPGGDLVDFQASPSDWNAGMQGQTVTVTVTGKTTADVPLALLSYRTQNGGPYASLVQKLHERDQVTLHGCETATLKVAVPDCYFQLDFIKTTGVTEEDIQRGWSINAFLHGNIIEAQLGGKNACADVPPTNPPTEPPVNPPTNPPTNPPSPPVVPELPPVNPQPAPPVGGTGGKVSSSPKRACSAIAAKSFRVRAKQSNTITVRVKMTKAGSRTKVRLRGAGISVAKKTNAKGTVTFRIKPKKAGRIRVSASDCRSTSVKVLSAKSGQAVGVKPQVTG